MRVIHLYNNTPTDPCMSGSYGEAEDYKLTVIASGAYTITCATPTNGTLSADRNNADENDVITITATPETDYLLTALTFTPEGGSAQNISIASMPYTFTMPAANVTVNATFSLPACPKPTNVTVSNLAPSRATVSWESNAGNYTVRYSTATITGTTLDPVFEDGFESGIGNWTTYANGYVSTVTSPTYNITDWHQQDMSAQDQSAHTGSYVAMSRSYDGTDRSVDNWLVSPQMTLGDVVKFWVCGDNAGWQEYYAVYVSTSTNAISDFTMIAAPELAPGNGTWAERSVDISAYAGQTGYVAIRHMDTGKDYLFIDDFGVYNTINAYSYGGWTTVSPNPTTESCQITGLSAETIYAVQVQANCGGTDGSSAWSTIYYFTTSDNCGAPQELASTSVTSTTAALSWADDKDSYNLQYRKVYFYEDFEGETLPTGWTTIDANSDGNTWQIGHAKTHSGTNGVYNISYIYDNTGISPNDWLVSPQLDLQGTLRVWLSGNNAYNYAEHFAILLSTTGNSVADFTTTLVAETTTTNSYVEYTADLSSYAGQQGYIAIHHFNCTDLRELYVDDFGLYSTENWVTLSPNPTTETATLTSLSAGTDYEWQVQGIDCDGVGGTTSWSATSNFTTLYPTKIRNNNPAADEMTWAQFAKFVSKGHSYSGETVTLMENINASDMVGTSSHSFCGTFDGDGKTITANISSSQQGAAPFRYISGATIQNLKVDGTVTSTAHHASGLVGFCADGSTNTIQNCHISTNVINNNAYNGDSGNNYMGGIIGHNMTATTSIIGCVYDGTLTSQGFKGGIIGFAGNNSTINLTNSYFGGGYSANGYTDPNFSPIGVKSSGRTENINFSNFYYNTEAGTFTASGYNIMNGTNNVTGSPKLSYTVTGATDVTVAMRGDYTHYDVSDIYGYGTGIVYNGTIIGGNADNLSLNLGYTGTGSCSGYVADYGDLSGSAYSRENDPYTLTMPNSNVEISVKPGTVSVDGSAVCSGRASTLTATTVGFNNPQFTWTASSSNAGLVSQNEGEIEVTPTAGGTYTYTCSVTEGSDATVISDNIELTMKQSPTGLAITGADAVCFGLTSALSASCSDNNATYSWNGGAGTGSSWTTPAITAATNVVVVATSANGCAVEENMTVTPNVPTSSERSDMGAGNGYYIWTGKSENWSLASNWMIYTSATDTYTLATAAPTASKNVAVGKYGTCVSSSSTLNINASAKAKALKIGADVTVSGSSTLTIAGSLTNNGTFEAPVVFNNTTTLYGTGSTTFSSVTINEGKTLKSSSHNITITGDCTNNGTFTAGAGEITMTGNLINNGTFKTGTGTVSLTGNWTNNGTYTAGNGVIIFAGTSSQVIGGSNATTFKNVQFSNNLTISTQPTITGAVTFSNGIITGDITLGNASTVDGASTNSYVNGKVTKIMKKNTTFTFPIGTASLYAPFEAKSSVASNVSVQYASGNEDMPDWWNHSGNFNNVGLDHASDRENWQVSASATTNLSNIKLYWNAASGNYHSFDEGTDALESCLRVAAVKKNGFYWQNLGQSAIEGDFDGAGSITAATPLAITVGAKAAGDDDYIVTFASTNKGNLLLPIDLTSFAATCDGRSTLVEWTTATEKNNDYFSLEHSDDAINFTEIARVAGAGNSIEPLDYSYTDYGIHGGDNYYRLVQVDYDGTRTVSEIVVANCVDAVAEDPEVMAYPNPFSGELTLVLDNFSNRAATIEVYDMLGKLIYTEKASAPQNSYETILNLSNLPSGAYTVRVSTTDFVINKNVIKS